MKVINDALPKTNITKGMPTDYHALDECIRLAFHEPTVSRRLSDVLWRGNLRLVILAARKCVFDFLKRFVDINTVERNIYHVMVGVFIDNALSRAANVFLKDSSSYGFETLPTNRDLKMILKVRHDILSLKLVCVSLAYFRIITPFWKGLFISMSFKTTDISFNGTSEERECVCFMSCPCESCPYKHKVYMNFDYHSVRMEQLEVHSHPIDDLLKPTRLDYIRGYVEYFTKLVDSPTATTIGRLIKSSMSTTDDPK